MTPFMSGRSGTKGKPLGTIQSHLFVPHTKDLRDSIVTREQPQEDFCIENLPKSMYFNSKRGERDIKKIKDDFMRNQIDHMNYNHFLSSKLGSNYYMGLNIKSLEKEIDELT